MIAGEYLDKKAKIEDEIQQLKRQALALQMKHRGPALESILKAMHEYEITPEEITQAFRKKGKTGQRASIAPKYRDPASGQTWSGRGRTPRWIADAEAAGRSRDDFLIKAAAQA